MGWRRAREWWKDEQDYYEGQYRDAFASEGTTYTKEIDKPVEKRASYWYTPKFDMSVGLETRVTQLIKTVSGKDLRLVQANGWGSDSKNFYYNPADLKDATDDEVLGLIFHQLARELYIETRKLAARGNAEKEYKHLLEALEDARADKLMVDKYNGADYYLTNVWHKVRKHTNPNIIPAVQFNYNVLAQGYGDTKAFRGDRNLVAGFKQARPHVDAYINAKSFVEALKHYELVKPFYPVPDENEQNHMNQMGGGLSEDGMQRAKRLVSQMLSAETKRNIEAVLENGGQGRGGEKIEKKLSPDAMRYLEEVAKNTGTIQTLYRLINSVLVDNDTKRYIGRKKRGKIDARALHKLVMQSSDRIFKQQREQGGKDYAFSLSVDISGSMMHKGRIESAFAGTVVLAEVLRKLGLPFQVHGFDEGTFNFKSMYKGLQIASIGAIPSFVGGSTNDLEAIKFMRKGFEHVPQNTRKVAFVITDGDGDGRRVFDSVREMRLKEGIQTIGIGIGGVSEHSLQQTYEKYVVVDNVSQLPTTLVNLMRSEFRRV